VDAASASEWRVLGMMLVMTIIGPASVAAGRWELMEWRTVDHVTGATLGHRAAAYSGYVAYWGRYQIDHDRIVHHVESSLFPGWVGGTQIRYFTLAGDRLSLRTPPIELAGDVVINELRWQRQESW